MFQSKLKRLVMTSLVLLVAIHGGPCLVLATLNLGTHESPFKCNSEGNLWCAGGASTSSSGTLHLTPDQRNQSIDLHVNTYGMALFSRPIDMLDDNRQWMSFSTHFTFKIETAYENIPGDGLTFVMLRERTAGAPGAAFGVYAEHGWQRVQTMAIEFDTFQNLEYGDITRNHVGVNLENLRSKVSRDAHYAGIALAGGEAIHAWIDYHALSEVLEVRISLDDTKPKESFLSYPMTLSDVFGDNGTVFVGFSGSNGLCTCHNFYSIYDWNFQVILEDRSILRLVELIGSIFVLFVIVIVLICTCRRVKEKTYVKIPDPPGELYVFSSVRNSWDFPRGSMRIDSRSKGQLI